MYKHVRRQPEQIQKAQRTNQRSVTSVVWRQKQTFCTSLWWKLRHTATHMHIETHACTQSQVHNRTPCWHLSVATISPQTFPFTDCQASVSTSGCFLRPVFLWKDTEGLRQAEGTYFSYFRLCLLLDTWRFSRVLNSFCSKKSSCLILDDWSRLLPHNVENWTLFCLFRNATGAN